MRTFTLLSLFALPLAALAGGAVPKGVVAHTAPTPPDTAPAPAPPAPKPVPAEGGSSDHRRPVAPKPGGIEQTGPTSWSVSRSLVNRWHEDPYRLGNVQESGMGYLLLGMRQRNGYHLGMRNSDLVLQVNGHKLNTMPQLLAAYLACKNDTQFTVDFSRSGRPMVHTYRIVD